MNRTLRVNDAICPAGSDLVLYQVVDPHPRGGSIKLFNLDKHQEDYIAWADINQALVDGTLVLKRKNAPRVSPAEQDDPKFAEELRTAMEQVKSIKAIQRKFNVSFSKAYAIATSDSRHAVTDIAWKSRATLSRYLISDRNGVPLLRGSKNKGNRTPRYGQAVVDLVVQSARTLYLRVGSRWALCDLVHYINDQARHRGLIGYDQKISQLYIKKTIHTHASVDPEKSRMDGKLVAAAKSIGANRVVARIPFERVEQDAVHLPFKAMTKHGVAETIYLIHAIDCCTSMPLGWHLVIGHPSESDGLRCIESTLFPKPHAFERLGLDPKHDRYGSPLMLVFDNGPEAKGERISNLTRLGIDPMHCKSHHAHGKPFIERLNKSLKEAIQVLPGCTRMDRKDGMRDPIALGDVLMTVQELESWIVRWYYESWANTPLTRHLRMDFLDETNLGSTPAERWKTITEDLMTPMPTSPSIKEWRSALYTHHERVLNRKTGVTIEGINYRGPNLPILLSRLGEEKVKILVDPDDVRQVYVNEGEDCRLVALIGDFVSDSTPAYSFSQIKEVLQREREQKRDTELMVAFRRDMHEASVTEITSKSPRGRKARREKARAVESAVRHTAAIKRAESSAPVSASGTPAQPAQLQTARVTDPQPQEADRKERPLSETFKRLPVINRHDGKEMK
ncbi:Mu transposase C-terminal domain-containing protein [Orrella marina]|uniref:Integrase n=1 Tax=Orrella marina TaxID=2163011 RepID=A0A2R4XLR6_9BURK|nr:Mu transposase C-terminal domain-containing protein [Orrella marina]AWB34740.1 integrase [Orrella marina]